MQQSNQEHALWRFALNYYSEPGVADALLKLQDENSLRVNMLIYAVWLASINRQFFTCDSLCASELWHKNVSVAVREKRRAVKCQLTELSVENEVLKQVMTDSYQALLSAELAAEKVELLMLYQNYQPMTHKSADMQRGVYWQAKDNIQCYCDYAKEKQQLDSRKLTDNLAQLLSVTCNFLNRLNIKEK